MTTVLSDINQGDNNLNYSELKRITPRILSENSAYGRNRNIYLLSITHTQQTNNNTLHFFLYNRVAHTLTECINQDHREQVYHHTAEKT